MTPQPPPQARTPQQEGQRGRGHTAPLESGEVVDRLMIEGRFHYVRRTRMGRCSKHTARACSCVSAGEVTYNWENLVGPFLVHNFLGPSHPPSKCPPPPPTPPPPTQLQPHPHSSVGNVLIGWGSLVTRSLGDVPGTCAVPSPAVLSCGCTRQRSGGLRPLPTGGLRAGKSSRCAGPGQPPCTEGLLRGPHATTRGLPSTPKRKTRGTGGRDASAWNGRVFWAPSLGKGLFSQLGTAAGGGPPI